MIFGSTHLKRTVYFNYALLRGHPFPKYYREMLEEDAWLEAQAILRRELTRLLTHCLEQVPYYQPLLTECGGLEAIRKDPVAVLGRLPVLTKELIRNNFEALKSRDLSQRRWEYNTSGGSTGEPIRLIQDEEYRDRSGAVTLLFSHLVEHELGQPEVRLWGSERDIFVGSMGLKARFFNFLRSTRYLNAFRMTPDRMREFIQVLNEVRPNLILAYAQSIYELALFAEHQGLEVLPPRAIMTSAGTLYPFMRLKLEQVFRCPVYNRYGSREVGDIACEQPGLDGLWVAPWGNYVEVLDDHDRPLPAGTDGELVITSLTNFAMPLLRYRIGDRGSLAPLEPGHRRRSAQVLQRVAGRNVDMFKTRDGTLIDGEYFTHLLYFRDWVKKFQVVQRDYDKVVIRVVGTGAACPSADLEEIIEKSRMVLGKNCTIVFEFLDEIPASESGKYRYTISEVA